MLHILTWLVSDKIFFNYFQTSFHKPQNNLLFYQSITAANHLNCSSFLFSRKLKKNQKIDGSYFSEIPSPKGIFSFSEEQKVLWALEMDKVPVRYREGLAKLLKKYRSNIFLCSVFSPHSFSYDWAKNSDFYFIKKRSWTPIIKQFNSVAHRLLVRESVMPDFPQKFTSKEKLVMRILFRYRDRFTSLEEVSSYVYGRRMTKNLHASEAVISELKKKLKKITGRDKDRTINSVRNCGYKIEKEVWNDLSSNVLLCRDGSRVNLYKSSKCQQNQ